MKSYDKKTIQCDRRRTTAAIRIRNSVEQAEQRIREIDDRVQHFSTRILEDQDQIINGIDSEILPRLFTKFATKSTMDTGLDLFISKSIIDAHRKIWRKNNYLEDKGATFGFSLPTRELAQIRCA